ncbi:MAG: hypothetical protein ACRENG_13350, partial [bacterium]
MSKSVKLLKVYGVNYVFREATGTSVLGIGVMLTSTNAGGYMNPNVIDGYSYSPASGEWYKPSPLTGEFDFSNPAPASKKAELDQDKRWRELNNEVEGVSPANGQAGGLDDVSIIDLGKNFPGIFDRYKDLFIDAAKQFNRIEDIDYDINGNVNSNFTAARNWFPRRDPLTLDLDNDGLETVGINPNAPI